MTQDAPSLVLGRGEVYFDLFRPGTRQGDGERYLGNTSTFQVGRVVNRIQRYASYNGQKVERDGAVTSEAHSVSFVTDNIAMENIGVWYGRESDETAIAPDTGIIETFHAKLGRYFQLGLTVNPFGLKYVLNVVLKVDGITIDPVGNYELTPETGRIKLLSTATDIADGDDFTVQFDWRGQVINITQSSAEDVHGALRFIATNPVGPKKNYYFPLVRLSPRGTVDLKGDEWQQVPFQVDVLRLNPATEQVYVDEILSVSFTVDEQAILDYSGISIESFPAWEDQIDFVINEEMGWLLDYS